MVCTPTNSWCPVEFPAELLDDNARTPLALPEAPPRTYAVLLAMLLEGADLPGNALNSVIATGTITLYGARQFLAQAGRLLDGPERGSREADDIVHELVVCASTLAREAPTSYALRQVGEFLSNSRAVAADTPPLRSRRRSLGCLKALEDALRPVDPTRSMETERYARFLVRMDEFYDDSGHQLARLAELGARPIEEARALFGGFLLGLQRDYVRASFEDNLSRGPGGPEDAIAPGEGLVELLPEFARVLR